jgi:integrase
MILEPTGSEIPIERRKLLTLADAREKARIGRDLAKAGINPSEHWRADPEETAAKTFREVAEARHRDLKNSWKNEKHRQEWLGSLERYAFPTLGDQRIDAIDTAAIEKVLMPIWLSKPETARRVKQRIASVLDHAHHKGWRTAEAPMRAVNSAMKAIKQPRRGNFAAMPYKDLPGVVEKLREGEASVGSLALQFLILNASRSGEIRFARWRELDLDAAEWRIPAERMKAGEAHIVPLDEASIAILRELQGLIPHKPSDLVFPGLKGPMSDATMAKAFRKVGGEGTVHGLRSTFRDWAAEHGFNNDWAEAALAHSVAGQEGNTVAAYKRTTFFAHRRDRLMPAWASFVLGTGNLISLAARRA